MHCNVKCLLKVLKTLPSKITFESSVVSFSSSFLFLFFVLLSLLFSTDILTAGWSSTHPLNPSTLETLTSRHVSNFEKFLCSSSLFCKPISLSVCTIRAFFNESDHCSKNSSSYFNPKRGLVTQTVQDRSQIPGNKKLGFHRFLISLAKGFLTCNILVVLLIL